MRAPLLAVPVTAARVRDFIADTHLIDQVTATHPTIRKVRADGGYRQHVADASVLL
ncbi:hypothetical protein ACFWA5_06365 [Streptomyces mirabilis]|uniref:hypothetical protein n=1 Tax=Streptomyces mirabilis TaxID=68239 RepID=UPI0036605BC3